MTKRQRNDDDRIEVIEWCHKQILMLEMKRMEEIYLRHTGLILQIGLLIGLVIGILIGMVVS